MRNSTHSLFDLARLRKASWLALLVVAWWQVSFAEHVYEHEHLSESESCEICVKYERLDDAAIDLLDSAATPKPESISQQVAESGAEEQAVTLAFDSRAPPKL